MKLMFAGTVGAMIGALQLLIMAFLESQAGGPSGFQSSDLTFALFILLAVVEMIGVMAISMNRIAPWVLWVLRADWELKVVREESRRQMDLLVLIVIACSLLRRALVMIDARSWSVDLVASLLVGVFCLIIPRRKRMVAGNK